MMDTDYEKNSKCVYIFQLYIMDTDFVLKKACVRLPRVSVSLSVWTDCLDCLSELSHWTVTLDCLSGPGVNKMKTFRNADFGLP